MNLLNTSFHTQNEDCTSDETVIRWILFIVWLSLAVFIGFMEYRENTKPSKTKLVIENAALRVFILCVFMLQMNTRPITCHGASPTIVQWIILIAMSAIVFVFSVTKKGPNCGSKREAAAPVEQHQKLGLKSNSNGR